LETLHKDKAHAPLPANRLDIRACHPAEKTRPDLVAKRFPRLTVWILPNRIGINASANDRAQWVSVCVMFQLWMIDIGLTAFAPVAGIPSTSRDA
jgi:hypothetical protein